MRLLLLGVAALTVTAAPIASLAGGFREGGPLMDAVRAVCDISTTQHMRNTGGMGPRGPGSGAGLCVFTSVEIESKWQNVPQLSGFQKWMTNKEGGGYPEKLARMIAEFCKSKGADVPTFVQHTGGDASFLELALKTGRMPCVTYAGADNFYPRQVAHMVCLAHLDDDKAAIIDNNRPGVWVWMSRNAFLDRWRAMNGGWGFVLLASPPPPYAARPAETAVVGCTADDPAAPDGFPTGEPAKPQPVAAAGQWSCNPQTGNCHWWVSGVCTHVLLPSKACVKADRFGNPTAEVCERPDAAKPQPAADVPVNYGLDLSKISKEKRYWLGEREVDQKAVFGAFGQTADGLSDDSANLNLTVVSPQTSHQYNIGFADKVRQAVEGLDPAVRQRLFVQVYAADHWAVGQFNLKPGVTLREAARGRVGAEIGTVAPEDCNDVESLRERLRKLIDRTPAPAPGPLAPLGPDRDGNLPWGLFVLIAVVLILALTKRS